ncbi:DUF3515 domain-containing protein [Nocardioides houyundeii]|uniref:DUF3515 domain-containing protein n=1 Tax=Nocardioides houyundeii TaxID=2045452 RepID=UPI0013B37FE4|nr:DUF3515 domain-containing protein [Nocardioides houyundeii]
MGSTLRGRPGTSRSRGVVASGAAWRARRGRPAAALALMAALVTGCTSISADGPELGAADARACRGLVDDLPQTLVDQERRDVEQEERGAAWGDPAIVLVCGVATPDSFDEFASCVETDGIGWFIPDDEVDDQSSAVTMTTVGHRPMVSVTLPATYRPAGPAAAMAQLATAVRDHTEEVDPCA